MIGWRLWGLLAIAIAIGAGVQQLRIVGRDADIVRLKLEWQSEKTTLAEGKATAERQAREAETALSNKERELKTTIANNAQEKSDEQKAHQNRLAAANAVNRGLQRQLDAITAAYHRDAADSDSTPSANQPPAGEAVKLLANLLGRCEERSVERASFADAAYAAGIACQQDYEAARAATVP